MMNKFNKLKAILFLFITQLSFASFVNADNSTGRDINTAGMDAQDEALAGTAGLASNYNLATIISVLIQTVLGFLGIVFLVLTIMAGFKWMASNGNEEEIKKAQGSLKNSIIGIVIVLAAYAITYSVFKYLPFTGGLKAGGG